MFLSITHLAAQVREAGLQNILALRGDPPKGHDKFVTVEGGFSCALDLVKYIRSSHGDYFGIAVAGYPEAHPETLTEDQAANEQAYRDSLQYLKAKVRDRWWVPVCPAQGEEASVRRKLPRSLRHVRCATGVNCPCLRGPLTTQALLKPAFCMECLQVDAGGQLIVTQLFYDCDKFLRFVKDCRAVGIECPILPGG